MVQIEYKLGDYEERPWGEWKVIAVGDDFIIKHLRVNPGYRSSLQRHRGRSEHWIILSGELVASVDGKDKKLGPADQIYIPTGSTHRMQNSDSGEVTFIEIQTGNLLSESDIERIEDDFGRARQ